MRLRQLRIERGYTQTQAAKLLGFSPPVYNRYETGASEPSFQTLVHIADFFNVSTDYLLGRTDDPFFEYRPAPDTVVLTNKKDPTDKKPDGVQIAFDLQLGEMMPKTPDELTEYIRKQIELWHQQSDEDDKS